MNIGWLVSLRVEVDGDEADRDVQGLSRDLMTMYERAELCVNWYKT